MIRTIPAALVAAGLLCALPAQAGLFDDDVARKQVNDLQKTTSQTLIDQNRQLERLQSELSEMRGQVEVLTNSVNDLEKRQKDLYLDLDNRLQALEAGKGRALSKAPATPALVTDPAKSSAKATDNADAKVADAKPDSKAAADDPSAVLKSYEAALGLFKAGKYKEAAAAFDKFAKTYPESEQAPAAQFWLGNSYYALGDCKQVITSQQKLLAKWPKNGRAPDAMANVANCQSELGQKAESQKTLKDLVSKYPDSKAAGAAKQQLKK
ncbi:MAG: tol-pal system protein YbgF [Fluviibacter sp.]